MGEDKVVERSVVGPGNNCRALAGAARGFQGEVAEGRSEAVEQYYSEVVTKKLAVLLRWSSPVGRDTTCKLYTSDPEMAGNYFAQRGDYTSSADLGHPAVMVEPADINALPDRTPMVLDGVRRTLGWLRQKKWNQSYVVAIDSETAKYLEIPFENMDRKPRACFVGLKR
jgi:hypothetical protein